MASAVKRSKARASVQPSDSIESAKRDASDLVSNAEGALERLKRSIVGLKSHLESAHSLLAAEAQAHAETTENLEGQLSALDKDSRAALAAAHASASEAVRSLKDQLRDLKHSTDLALSEKDRELDEQRHAFELDRNTANVKIAALEEKLRKVQAQLA